MTSGFCAFSNLLLVLASVGCLLSLQLWASMQADAPVATGYGINWYGGPVLNNKAGFVVSPSG